MKRPISWFCLTMLVLVGGAASAGSRPADAVLDLPIRDVTVFSDRARVTRSGEIRLDKGVQTLTLTRLPATVDPESVRVEATGARIARVELKRATLDEFPRPEAEKLLRQIETLHDEEAALRDQLDTLDQERRMLQSLRPTTTPRADDHSPSVLLDPAGWHASLQFVDAREAAIVAAIPSIETQLKKKHIEIAAASARAEQIAAGTISQDQLKVSAVVEGDGKTAQISLTYMARNAVWHPIYDVRFTPGESTVDVGFAALVSQQTGEPWTDARLTLSTAVPLATATLPQLSVWKIGERERFIPIPQAAPATQPQPQLAEAEPLDDSVSAQEEPTQASDEMLRSQLLTAANDAKMDERGRLGGLGMRGAGAGDTSASRRQRLPARMAKKHEAPQEEADSLRQSESPPPPPAAPMVMLDGRSMNQSEFSKKTASIGSNSPREESIAFTSPRSWQQPYFAGDLPAALAGGYTFTYPSARTETVRSDGETRNIALYTKKLPAAPFLKLLPALSKQAFLVTEITNTGERPLLGGQAHLFVGADLVGDAMVPTTAIGQKVTLPLGIDDAIRTERNVTVVEAQRGVFSKQDVSTYTVAIEVMNPRSKAMKARVLDQLPLPQAKEVEITLDRIDPVVKPDATDGVLAWDVDLAPGAKKTISFTYTVARPKDSKFWQRTAPAGDH